MSQQNITAESNPLLDTKSMPAFDRIQPEHVVPAVRHVIAELLGEIEHLEANLQPTWRDLMEPMEQMEVPLVYAWGPVSHLLGVKNSEALRTAHETVLGEVVALGMRIGQSQAIYRGLKDLRGSDEGERLTEPQRRLLDLTILTAELSGVGLADEAKQRFTEIQAELSQISTDFSNHVLDATKAFALMVTDPADTEGWPETLRQLAAQSHDEAKSDSEGEGTPDDGPWRITLDMPSFVLFMRHSRQRDQRERLYRAYITRASEGDLDNTELIERILRLRREKAQLLGFDSFAEMSLATKMAPSVGAVEGMLDELHRAARPHAEKDLEELRQLASEGGQTEPLAFWDIGFWAELLRERRFDYTDEELRPYFPLRRVQEGMFALAHRLFGVSIEPADGKAPVWHPDVRYFEVRDDDGTEIASFYLDPYSRPHEKRGGAWMVPGLDRRWVEGELRTPVVYLCCNGTPPVGDRPSLMSFGEVATLFHEFGHGLQSMLTTVDISGVAGLNGIEWDALELPSQFMENWCYHKPTLIGMTEHYETKEPLPDELFEKICASRNYRSGSFMMQQLEAGMADMQLHHLYDPEGDESALDVYRRVAADMTLLPLLEEERFLCGFVHIFAGGYAAGYYSYKWADVLAADAFAAFEEAGLEDEAAVAKLGRRFRDTVLAGGGSRHPMAVFKDFRGREPKTEALLRHSGLAAPPT
jgi:oligopeptidase A